jgi:diguanylate cyclase (GGDEF)-like protein
MPRHLSHEGGNMVAPIQNLTLNARLLKARVNKYAVIGVIISFISILIATTLSAYFQFGKINLESFIKAQTTNMGIWFLDAMPFIFALWGQYMGTVISYEAGAIIADQTQELRDHAEALEKKAMHGATHDALTGLPNRTLFRDRILQAVRNAKREKHQLGVLLLDLDRFKEINDTMGHYNGDRIVKQVAMRLESLVRESDTLARLGGDEFGILLQTIHLERDISTVAKKIHIALRPSFMVEELTIDVQASIGAVVYPDHGDDVDTLIQRADIAMYVAKQEGKDNVIYSPGMDQHSPHRLTLIGDLRRAMENDELVLFFQPKVNCKTGTVLGVESLIRWKHKEHGLMPPDEFVPMAEKTGLIKQLSRWVLKNALQQGVLWHTQGHLIDVAVNLSTRNLLDPDFPDVVAGMLASHPFPPSSLIMEITETTIMSDPEYALETINRIAKMGIRFSIDDFGTGYSSLSYLKQLPISEIKVDKSFVIDMLKNENDAVIVRATIELAHNLGLKVVAEGVETEATLVALRNLECDVVQGYYIARPLSKNDFKSWYQVQTQIQKA